MLFQHLHQTACSWPTNDRGCKFCSTSDHHPQGSQPWCPQRHPPWRLSSDCSQLSGAPWRDGHHIHCQSCRPYMTGGKLLPGGSFWCAKKNTTCHTLVFLGHLNVNMQIYWLSIICLCKFYIVGPMAKSCLLPSQISQQMLAMMNVYTGSCHPNSWSLVG